MSRGSCYEAKLGHGGCQPDWLYELKGRSGRQTVELWPDVQITGTPSAPLDFLTLLLLEALNHIVMYSLSPTFRFFFLLSMCFLFCRYQRWTLGEFRNFDEHIPEGIVYKDMCQGQTFSWNLEFYLWWEGFDYNL